MHIPQFPALLFGGFFLHRTLDKSSDAWLAHPDLRTRWLYLGHLAPAWVADPMDCILFEYGADGTSVARTRNELCALVIQEERLNALADTFCKPSPSSRIW
jgi:hypothetical protein